MTHHGSVWPCSRSAHSNAARILSVTRMMPRVIGWMLASS
jgi:hypothetical protein